MEKGSFAYYNGRFGGREKIALPLSDRSIFFGDAVYDMMVGERGVIHQAFEHIFRLLSGAETIGLDHGFTAEKICEILHKAVELSGLFCYTVYVQLSRRSKRRTHAPDDCGDVGLLVTVDPYEMKENYEPIRLMSAPDLRYRLCNVKTVNLLPAVLASREARDAGCDEAVFIRDGFITECAHSNISILKEGVIYTHPLSEFILPGITRKHLLLGASELGIPTREVPFTLKELLCADEVLVTSTTKLLRLAGYIDSVRIGGRDQGLACALRDYLWNEYYQNFHK